MAIYQGARQPGAIAFPSLRRARVERDVREADRSARPSRRRAAASTNAARRGLVSAQGRGRVGLALAGIVVAFSVGFVSLSQSVRVAATSYDITRLTSEHDRLIALDGDLRSDLRRLQGGPAIRKEALDAGLGQLGAAVVLPAR